MFNIYTTNALKILTENSAHAVMGGGKMLQKSWYELIDIDKPQEPQKSSDEIALDIIARAGLHQKGGE